MKYHKNTYFIVQTQILWEFQASTKPNIYIKT